MQVIPSTEGEKIIPTRAPVYNPNSPAKTFEDLFFPHWFENGTYTFNVPGYMHKFKLAETLEWAKYYQYGAENGRFAVCNITDNLGNSYGGINNTAYGVPIGGSGRCNNSISGSKLIISVKGKIMIQFGIWGSWFENIIEGGVYNITFSGSKIALYMDYYNPTNRHTFYFKASQPIYAYLFDASGNLIDHTDKPQKEGSVTEPYDATPFLVFIRPMGIEGNITVQFWMGYKEKKLDYDGVFIVLGVFVAMATIAYIFSRKSVYGTNERRKYK